MRIAVRPYLVTPSPTVVDIKPENILINQTEEVKIADLGLTKNIAQKRGNRPDTDYIATIWYRAPELLLSPIRYEFGVDVWSSPSLSAPLQMFR